MMRFSVVEKSLEIDNPHRQGATMSRVSVSQADVNTSDVPAKLPKNLINCEVRK